MPEDRLILNDEEATNLGAAHADEAWREHGAKAVFKVAVYRGAVADLDKQTTNPRAKTAFDAALLAHARSATAILFPKLPRHPLPADTQD